MGWGGRTILATVEVRDVFILGEKVERSRFEVGAWSCRVNSCRC